MSTDLTTAPLFTDFAAGPADGAAWWMGTLDNVRIRVGAWGRDATQGTVLLFPGRTEYIEKYGPAAQDLRDRGFATLSVDWRGQGLADRFLPDPLVGHVEHFSEYQMDVSAMLRAAKALDLPKPWFLLGHSMGGCIGLRALMEDLPVSAAAFTGPMWGIRMAAHMRPAAWALGWLMPKLRRGGALPPGTKSRPYVQTDVFDDNMLTRDPAMYEMMQKQLNAQPDLSLGGPSYTWLRAALYECRDMSRLPSPQFPTRTFLGTNERIVDVARIHDRMNRWESGVLEMVEGGEHEVLMDTPDTRRAVFDSIAAHFDSHR